jgi:plastocyanin
LDDAAHDMLSDDRDLEHGHMPHPGHNVVAGIGEVTSTAGGSSTVSIVRFVSSPTIIHAGETVEWTNEDPVTPHTITFGPEPQDLFDASANVTIDKDGARHAIIASTADKAHSGFIMAAPQERLLLNQLPLSATVTRFRVTFPNAGTFPYICALHDDLGMVGVVIVKP